MPPRSACGCPGFLRLATLALLGAAPLLAEPPPPTPPPLAAGDDLRIREVFTSHLPQTLRAGGLRVFVHPHLGDFNVRDYLRVTTGVRYGLTSRWEINAETEGYFSHGLGDVRFFKDAGFSTLQLGTKYNLDHHPFARWESAIGFDCSTPLGHPPADLTDGMRHFNPYLTSSRRLPSHPDIRLFWGVGVDLVSHVDIDRELQKNQIDDHTTVLTAGAVWDRRAFHYTFEMAWASSRLVGHTRDDTLTIRPGIIWEVPWFRAHHPGRSILLGAALRASVGPDGTGLGVGAKLRVNFDPKRHEREVAPPPPTP